MRRCECTVWEAREAYRRSHLLYHKQRLALLLQVAARPLTTALNCTP